MPGRTGAALVMLAAGCTADPPMMAKADIPVFTAAPVPSSKCAPVVKPTIGEDSAALVGALVALSLIAAGGKVDTLGKQGTPPRTAANGQRC